jgi:hypothetical protein
MDFSSTPRALESLIRRQPSVEDDVLEACRKLLLHSEGEERGGDRDDDDVVVSSLTALLRHDARWESLAVGLCVSTASLLLLLSEGQQEPAAKPHPSTLYVEFPRVPPLAAAPGTSAAEEEGVDKGGSSGTATPTASLPPPPPPPRRDSSATTMTPSPTVALLLSPEQARHLCREVHGACLAHLDHSEPRVRTLVAKAIPAYLLRCRRMDAAASGSIGVESQQQQQQQQREHARELYARLTASIRQHLEEDRNNLSSNDQLSKSSTGAFDDTTGWRALETNWLCLKALVHALSGPDYFEILPLDPSVLDDCRTSAVEHVSRHIRAAALQALEQWIVAAAAASTSTRAQMLHGDNSSPLRQTTIAVLKSGLDDNWSQVRMAACVLGRVFLTALQHESTSLESAAAPAKTPLDFIHNDDVYRVVLPRVCLNRFYSAHGVKLYSHETWFQIVHDRGVDVVAHYLPAFVRYYVQMCDANSHVVRESACQALAELARRLGSHNTYRAALARHVEPMLQALVVGFHDESWPVRDEAGLACAVLCKTFPDECRSELPLLWDRWTEQVLIVTRETIDARMDDYVLALCRPIP